MKCWTLHFDGLCEPRNPGGAMAAAYRLDADEMLEDGKAFEAESKNTNNVAEYYALGFGLRAALERLKASKECGGLNIFGDSRLVVEQVTGEWACNKDRLIQLRDRCRDLIAEISRLSQHRVTLTWIPREQNEAADRVANAAYTKLTGRTVPIRRPRQKV